MAVGAETGQVLRMVLGEGAGLVAAAIVIGFAGSMAVTRAMQGLLFGIASTDPLTYLTISLLLAGVSLTACYLPARRASRVDPLLALRHD